ncbi:SlyX family protein [Acidovorax sp. GBBC 3334]|uniref:SlyX family protein n=1 Tax=unclassified Acidovorax TaxID=2684926 RepID=UPI002304395B|nr:MULTISPECIES: SlyX family protein [unclassified Acidovorax]MDA8454232.1 SlyX family protein [Acidovorax sp. GBBC 3334]MDA8520102.1 SlyX family protein [Acidovorax sp. NCPPB 4044]
MSESRTPSQRLDELEIKASYADDLLDQLNVTLYRQQQQIDALQRALATLQRQLPDAGDASAARNPRDELPPHY